MKSNNRVNEIGKGENSIKGLEAIIEFGKLGVIENNQTRKLLIKVIRSLIFAEEKLAYLDGYLNGFK